MKKSELIPIIAARFPQLTHEDVFLSVQAILNGIAQQLGQGERVEIRGFGSFDINFRPARTGRNPKTGESVQVQAKRVPHFKAGLELRKIVNQS